VIGALVEDLDSQWTDRDYGAGTWSVHQIVGHLIWGERTDWIPRARRILEQGEKVAFDPFDRSGHLELCRQHSLSELVELFAVERTASLEALREMKLRPEHLSRRGRHPALGPATLSELLAAWVVHDLNHIAQICKAMAFQYRDASGPWEAYLSILASPNPR
jgi:hypothetical protein